MTNIRYSSSRDIAPAAIRQLRASVGWQEESDEIWQRSLTQARAVVSAWDGDKLIGICFLAGLELTGLVTDFTVHTGYQGQGVGSQILRRILKEADHMQNVFLFYETSKPELADYYGGFGFTPAGSGMWYRPPGASR